MASGINLEKRLWNTADKLRADSGLRTFEYSFPVLGLIFLRYANYRFSKEKENIKDENQIYDLKTYFQAKGIPYIPEKSRYSYLLNLPEGKNIGKSLNNAMKGIEKENSILKDVLPKDYTRIDDNILIALLKSFSKISMDIEGDVFGKIYEYFLGKFAMAEGKKGGEFFTPSSLVKLIVEVIEPYHGYVLDPASGSGGMFVQSAKFVERHKKDPAKKLALYGQEKTADTIRLAKMNLAVHGLEGEIKQGNTFYEDIHNSFHKFDFVMANPPFNVKGVDYESIKDDKRYNLGLPSGNNANYLWIQIFYSALNEKGRAGFVMANAASDASGNEKEIRRKLIEDENAVDVMIAIGPNFFYTVTLPCTLWFFDKGKKNTDRRNKVLFIDARNIYKQIDRAHREFIPAQIEFISNIVRLYRREELEIDFIKSLEKQKDSVNKRLEEIGKKQKKSKEDNIEISVLERDIKIIDKLTEDWKNYFPDNNYRDVKGLCKSATIEEIKEQNWSLNPGRYIGVPEPEEDDYDFNERLKEYNDELEKLNEEAHKLEKEIKTNVHKILTLEKK